MQKEIICGRATGIRRRGEGDPALLVHCSLAHSGAWSGVMNALKDRLSMTAIDLPGHGLTDFDPAMDMQDQSSQTAIELLERMDGPSHLIGHSFGATVALRVAIERPDLVASLSLYEPVYISLLAEFDKDALQEEDNDSREFIDHALNGDWEKSADAFLRRWGVMGGLSMMPEAQREYAIRTMPMILENTKSVIDPNGGGKTLKDMAKVSTPCLLMEGAHSPKTISRVNDALEQTLPNVKRKVFENAGHMGPITHPLEVAQAIREFLSGDDF